MWWHRPCPRYFKHYWLGTSAVVAGCGFQPLYKREEWRIVAVRAALAAVTVGIIPNREGSTSEIG